jgi:hypothetical protein
MESARQRDEALMRVLTVLALTLIWLGLFSPELDAQQPFEIGWAAERLTVRATDAPLADLIAEVSRVTGIDVTGAEKLAGLVSIDFTGLPARQALTELLSNVNYLVQDRPGPAGRLIVTVQGMAGGDNPGSASTPITPIFVPALLELVAEEAAVIEEEKQEEREDDPDFFDDEVRELKAEVAQLVSEGAFGAEASVNSLAELAGNLDNEEIRLEALKALSTRPLEAALPTLTTALGDDSLDVRSATVEILGRARDAESLEAIGQLAIKTGDRNVRISALRVLALRANPESAAYLRTLLGTDSLKRDPQVRKAVDQMLEEHDYRERRQAQGR